MLSIRFSRFLPPLSAVALSLTLVTSAWAQSAAPSAGDMETARALVLQARELRDKGDHVGALEKYKAAHALAHTPITGIELAHTYAKLMMPVEARDVCLQVQRSPVGVAETERSVAARAEAVTFADEMQKQAASLRILLRIPATVPPGTRPSVAIDGHEVPFEAVGQVQRINPGKHEVTARIGEGKLTVKWVEATAGSQQDVTLDVAAPPEPTQDTPKPLAPEGTTHLSPLVPVGLSVAGLGAVFGVLGGVVALNTEADLRNNCENKVCPPDAKVDIAATQTRARVWATISTIGFGVTIVGGFVALYGFLNPVRTVPSAATANYRLRVQPTLGGLSVDGHF